MKSTVTAVGSDSQNSDDSQEEFLNTDEHVIKTPKKEKEVFTAHIMQTKVQRLKNTTKLAKVLIVEESNSKNMNYLDTSMNSSYSNLRASLNSRGRSPSTLKKL